MTMYECRGLVDGWRLVYRKLRASSLNMAKKKFRRLHKKIKYISCVPVG